MNRTFKERTAARFARLVKNISGHCRSAMWQWQWFLPVMIQAAISEIIANDISVFWL